MSVMSPQFVEAVKHISGLDERTPELKNNVQAAVASGNVDAELMHRQTLAQHRKAIYNAMGDVISQVDNDPLRAITAVRAYQVMKQGGVED